MPGPKPKPAAIKLAAGNPGHRPVNSTIPTVEGEPEPPPHLDKEARAEWHRTIADLAAMGLLGQENRTTLAVYCQAWSRMVEAEKHVAKHGVLVPAPRTGVPMVNPHLRIATAAAAEVTKLAAEFGMTPSSRTRVAGKAGASAKASPWDSLDTLTVIDGGKAKAS